MASVVANKRHRKVLRDNIQGITKPTIRRLARRGDVKRISGFIYNGTREVVKVFLENVIRVVVVVNAQMHKHTQEKSYKQSYNVGRLHNQLNMVF